MVAEKNWLMKRNLWCGRKGISSPGGNLALRMKSWHQRLWPCWMRKAMGASSEGRYLWRSLGWNLSLDGVMAQQYVANCWDWRNQGIVGGSAMGMIFHEVFGVGHRLCYCFYCYSGGVVLSSHAFGVMSWALLVPGDQGEQQR